MICVQKDMKQSYIYKAYNFFVLIETLNEDFLVNVPSYKYILN